MKEIFIVKRAVPQGVGELVLTAETGTPQPPRQRLHHLLLSSIRTKFSLISGEESCSFTIGAFLRHNRTVLFSKRPAITAETHRFIISDKKDEEREQKS